MMFAALAAAQDVPGSVQIPTSLVITALVFLVGSIIAMAKIVQNANKAVLDERQLRLDAEKARLTFVETKLAETEKREVANAETIRMQLELATAQTRGALRRPGSLPGIGGAR